MDNLEAATEYFYSSGSLLLCALLEAVGPARLLFGRPPANRQPTRSLAHSPTHTTQQGLVPSTRLPVAVAGDDISQATRPSPFAPTRALLFFFFFLFVCTRTCTTPYLALLYLCTAMQLQTLV